MAIRSFLAFDLPAPMAATVERISNELKRTSLQVRWVAPANIHLTVVFLGDVAEDSVGRICDEVGRTVVNCPAFKVDLSAAGFFGTIRSPRVLWIGLEGETDRMGKLRDALQGSLAPFGIRQEERPFRPHLTLGRFKEGARGGKELEDIIQRYKAVGCEPCTMDSLVLYRSELRPNGPVYSPLHKWRLNSVVKNPLITG